MIRIMQPVFLSLSLLNNVLSYHWLTDSRRDSDRASSGLIASSIMMKFAPRPVKTPSTEVARRKPRPGVCHEHERELVMLYRRWKLASRSRPAGAGFKPPGAAAFKRRGGERPGKSLL